MPVRPIVLYALSPEVLRRQSEPIRVGPGDARQTLADLKDTLRHHGDGVGLAAPQIGVHQRVIAVRLAASAGGQYGAPIGILNPVISARYAT